MITDTIEQRLLAKIRKLSARKVREIEDFIDFLYERESQSEANLTVAAMQLSEATFTKVWNNPEDAAYDNL
jgi:hypothetical protein